MKPKAGSVCELIQKKFQRNYFHFFSFFFTYPYSVNMVVKTSDVLPTAILVAKEIIQNSPDAVQCTKKGLQLSQQFGFQDAVLTHAASPESNRVYTSENIKVYPFLIPHFYTPKSILPCFQEGLKAFTEVHNLSCLQFGILTIPQKRTPVWKNPAKL